MHSYRAGLSALLNYFFFLLLLWLLLLLLLLLLSPKAGTHFTVPWRVEG